MQGILIRLPSEFSVLEPLQLFIEGIGEAAGVEEDDLSSLSISVLELVKNGMEHGNGGDPAKMVTISIDALESMLRFHVDDEGTWIPKDAPGFQPGEGEELLSCRGRGVLIARNLAKWVDYGLTPEGRTRATLIWPLN